MRYSSIRKMDISNGTGIGISLFVQGCHFKCKNCFNKETWDFYGGKIFDRKVEHQFIELADKDFIKRISLLGGEPLANENVKSILRLVKHIRDNFNCKKSIWLYTGYTLEEIFKYSDEYNLIRQEIIRMCDVVVDGKYVDELKDSTLLFRGSSNQRVIKVKDMEF